jgi:glucose-fructose oxidoreductase
MTNRRKFLKQTVAGVAGLSLSQHAFANILISQKKEKLGVALVGLGYYSTDLLAPALQLTQKCSLAGIVTGTPEKAEKWKQQYNIPDKNIYNYETFDSIANNPDIDVVYVVLPPSMHAEYSIRAAKAGKHVWCEKPMAMTEAECQSMIDACKKNKVTLAIGYRLQHEPNTQRIIQIRKDGVYGKVQHVDVAAGYRENRTTHWKQIKSLGGGVMYDMGVYPLNAARYATGLEPIAVTAKASVTRPEIYKEVEEVMNFDLEFPGGVTAKCEATFSRGVNVLETKFANGWYKLEPYQNYSGLKGVTSDGKVLDAVIPNQQAKQMDDDATAILNKKSLLVPGEEGLKDIRVVEAIYKSVKDGSKRIKIG